MAWAECRANWTRLCSAELKGPRNILRIRPEIFGFEPDLGLKHGQTKHNISGTEPTNRHTTIPNDSGPMSACFDDDSQLLNSEIAQPRFGLGLKPVQNPAPGPARGKGES